MVEKSTCHNALLLLIENLIAHNLQGIPIAAKWGNICGNRESMILETCKTQMISQESLVTR